MCFTLWLLASHFKVLVPCFLCCLWKAVKSSSPSKGLSKGFPTVGNWEAVREDVGVWNQTVLGPLCRINLSLVLSISFFGLKTFQGFCLKKRKIRRAKYWPEEETSFRLDLQLLLYFSCRKVTQNIFTGGDKISQVRNVLTSRWCLFPTKFAHHKIWPGPLGEVWLLGKKNSLVPSSREYLLSRANTSRKCVTSENWSRFGFFLLSSYNLSVIGGPWLIMIEKLGNFFSFLEMDRFESQSLGVGWS